MAQYNEGYGSQGQMRQTDEYGNRVQESGGMGSTGAYGTQQGMGGIGGGEYGTQGQGTGMGTTGGGAYGTQGGTGMGAMGGDQYGTQGTGMGMGTGGMHTQHHEGQQQLRRSDSSSSVS